MSFFAYQITRPYPFKYFTPLAITGGVVFFVLFTVLNLITSGYYLSTEFSQAPNETMAGGLWFKNWPSYFSDKMQPSCEPVTFPVGSKYFTNHTGLTYTLINVLDPLGAANGTLSPSLSYLNNVIDDCEISLVEIELEAADRTGWQYATQQWGSTTRAFITCSILGPKGPTIFNLTVEYDLLPKSMAGFEQGAFKFLHTDRPNNPGLWWGESLVSMYWNQLSYVMQKVRDADMSSNSATLRKGSIELTPVKKKDDITQLDFFNLQYRFITDTTNQIIYNKVPLSPGECNRTQQYPNVWLPADALGKSLYSVALADLGQKTSSILTSPTALEYYTQPFPEINNLTGVNAKAGPANTSYVMQDGDHLQSSPAIFSAKYLCQVPRRKAMGSLIMSILLANLVLLQAYWTILSFLAGQFVENADDTAHHCVGCIAQTLVPLKELPSERNQLGQNEPGTKPVSDCERDVERSPEAQRLMEVVNSG
ncbi:hypothetical protein BP6252_06726 [Coleophoma cylindrospora]|uniref:Uncharacterized protein n=1 Tax=Coleophoma cylindrospora TaxID=1849047 RepID=A0A3D8RFJ4_9HELO|nr:hypothetical protein BP6252_06726 [Coleophoma cylindrospora]